MQTWSSRKMPRYKISKQRKRNWYRNPHDSHFSYVCEKCLAGNTLRRKSSFPFTAWLLSLGRKALRQEGENGQSHRIHSPKQREGRPSLYSLPPPLPRLHFLKLPQPSYTMLPTEAKCSNMQACGEHFTPNHNSTSCHLAMTRNILAKRDIEEKASLDSASRSHSIINGNQGKNSKEESEAEIRMKYCLLTYSLVYSQVHASVVFIQNPKWYRKK